MNPALPFLLFTELWTDFNLILKVMVLLTIISWVKNHVTSPVMAVVITGVLSIIILFDFWRFFGGIYVLYMLVMFGISGVIVDFFFVTQNMGAPGHVKNSPVSSGAEFLAKRPMHRPGGPPGG
ncbi:MAG: hypothetical protein HY917_01855 [Candidatus Diapherotrites archaeon]|nr:hypothetical protein [Candidatus Diapherotrites archaeon]